MDGNVIAALIFGAIAWGAIISLGVMRFKPSHTEVEQIAGRVYEERETAKRQEGVKSLGQRLEAVTSTLEAAAGVTNIPVTSGHQGESPRRLPAGADFEHQPCRECGQVYVINVMQRVEGFVEHRDRGCPDYVENRLPAEALWYCPQHKKDYQIAVRQQYRSYRPRTINQIRADEFAGKLPLWRYYNIVPAQRERWDEVHGVDEPVKVKRGRKSAADRLREATARGEDVTAETPSVTRTRRVKSVANPEPTPEPAPDA